MAFRISYLCISSQDYADSKQKSYKTSRMKIFGTMEKVDPKIENASIKGSEDYNRTSDKVVVEICGLLGFYAA